MAKAQEKETKQLRLESFVAKLVKSAEEAKKRKVEIENGDCSAPIWVDDLRGIPNSLARGVLFTAAKSDQRNKREFFRGK